MTLQKSLGHALGNARTRGVGAPRLMTVFASAFWLSGCASAVYEGRYAWEDGWRKGEILQATSVADLERPTFYECIRAAGGRRASGQFATVKYLQMGKARYTAVPISADQVVRPGEKVYVKLGDCSRESLAKRTD